MSNYTGKTAITFGVFDLLHFGHFELFRRIRELVGETGKVYVMLQIDEMIAKYKPGCKSVYDFTTRQKMIETLRTVDKAIPYDVVGVEAVKDIGFDVLVVGPEHQTGEYEVHPRTGKARQCQEDYLRAGRRDYDADERPERRGPVYVGRLRDVARHRVEVALHQP